MTDKLDIGIIIETSDPEKAWNAFRFGITALGDDDVGDVSVFLLGEGVECEETQSDDFNVQGKMQEFHDAKGDIKACGTCLELRNQEESEVCPVSTMTDMLNIVKNSDRVLTIG